MRDLGLFGITDVPLRFTTCMSDTCVSVLCVCLYLHVSSVDVCVHVFVGVVCVHVCVLSVYVCMCDSDSVYVCMGVICVYKHKEQRSNEHTSGQELWLLLTLQYNVSLPSHWPRLMNFLNSQSFPWTSHCPLTLCKRDPCEWKKRVITHAQMYTYIHVYTLYTNTCTCTCKNITDKCTHVVQLTDRHQQFTNTNKARTRRALKTT